MNFLKNTREFSCLQHALITANDYIRKKFKIKWKEIFREEWISNKNNGTKLYSLLKDNNIREKIKKMILSGKIDSWDLTIFSIIFQNKPFFTKSIWKNISSIVNERNKLSHRTVLEMSEDEFESSWLNIKKALIDIGYKDDYFDKIKESIFSDEIKLNMKTEERETNQSIMNDLKEHGSNEFKNKNFKKAIEFYSAAINMGNLTDHELSILYSNRSLTYLKLYQSLNERTEDILYDGLSDAYKSLYFNTQWYKPYCRLGQIYQELNELEKSEINYEIALLLNPKDDELKNSLAFVRKKMGEQQRLEHLDPHYLPGTVEEKKQPLESKMVEHIGYPRDKLDGLREMAKKLDPVLEDVWKAHEYRDGSASIKQDYELAAKYYSKAALKGNAEALYNLALLTMNGQGVRRDFAAAINFLKQAAAKEPMRKLGSAEIPNVGVAEAQHSLGLAYQQGTYVEENLSQAVYWYQLAVDNGSGPAANNLGLLYFNGIGVEQDIKRAENLLLLSHKRNDSNSMVNLVDLYLREKDHDKALLWHERSLETNYLMNSHRDEYVRECLKIIKQEKESIRSKKYPGFVKLIQLNEINRIPIKEDFKDVGKSLTAKNIIKAIELIDDLSHKLNNNLIELKELCEKLLTTIKEVPEAFYVIDECLSKKIVAEIVQEMKLKKIKLIDLDIYLQIVYLYLYEDEDIQNIIKFLDASIKKNPKIIEFIELKSYIYLSNDQMDEAINGFNEVLSTQPKNIRCLIERAKILMKKELFYEASLDLAVCCNLMLDSVDTPKSLEAFQLVTECFTKLNVDKHLLNDSIKSAKLSELCCKKMPFFKINSVNRDFTCKEIKIFEPLNDPYRKSVLVNHRHGISQLKAMQNTVGLTKINNTHNPPRKQTKVSNKIEYKLIKLNEIDFTCDHVLEGYCLEVTNFDQLMFGMTSVFFIIEDENKNVERMAVYNLGKNIKKIEEKYPIGCRLSIKNPYVRIAFDNKPMIRIDLPDSIEILSDKKRDRMCRYCGKEKSSFKCVRCNADYCSKECQTNDWKFFEHKSVCL